MIKQSRVLPIGRADRVYAASAKGSLFYMPTSAQWSSPHGSNGILPPEQPSKGSHIQVNATAAEWRQSAGPPKSSSQRLIPPPHCEFGEGFGAQCTCNGPLLHFPDADGDDTWICAACDDWDDDADRCGCDCPGCNTLANEAVARQVAQPRHRTGPLGGRGAAQFLEQHFEDLRIGPPAGITRGRHSTSMGVHNLNMLGNMPIAHGEDPAPSAPMTVGGALAESPVPLPIVQRRGKAQSGAGAASARAVRGSSKPARSSTETPTQPNRASGGAPSAAQMLLVAACASPLENSLTARRSPRHVKHEASTTAIDDEIENSQPRGGARHTSPQPPTARAARRWAARDEAAHLQLDESKYALCSDKPELLAGLVIDATDARDAGIPHGTASADEWGFAWAKRFAIATGNAWMRPRAVFTALDVRREVMYFILMLVWISQMIAPSARRKSAGYGQGKPTSALLAVYAYRRVLRDCGRYIPEMAEVRATLKGICARYKVRWGPDAFVPARKQPFSTRHLIAIVTVLAAASMPGWPPVLCQAMLVAFCHAISTGARKDEWTLSFEGDTLSRRSSFTWVDADYNELPMTPAVIASRRNGCLLRGRSAPSKCDRLNIEWGSRDMWFRYDDTNPLNFAWRWQQWEISHPCPIAERDKWPAFSPTGDATPFSGSHADRCLRAVLAIVMTAAEAACRSWHSCRVTIATRLFARRGEQIKRDEIEGIVQSVVRWKTPEAMRIYARIEPEQYADYVELATTTDAPASIPADLPEIDPEHVLPETEAALAHIEREAAAAAKAARAATRDETTEESAAVKRKRARKPTPASGEPSGAGTSMEDARPTFDLGDGKQATHLGDDSWDVCGQTLRLHNSLWGIEGDEYTECKVVGYIGAHHFESGAVSRHTYVIEDGGYFYAVRHDTVARCVMDAATRRRLRKAAAPKLV